MQTRVPSKRAAPWALAGAPSAPDAGVGRFPILSHDCCFKEHASSSDEVPHRRTAHGNPTPVVRPDRIAIIRTSSTPTHMSLLTSDMGTAKHWPASQFDGIENGYIFNRSGSSAIATNIL